MAANSQTIVQLCSILGGDDATLPEEVLLAANDPHAYLEQFGDDLLQRGIEEPERVSFWLALVDGLLSRQALFGFDWKDQAENLAGGLDLLMRRRDVSVDWQPLTSMGDDYRPTTDYAEVIQKILRTAGLVAVWLDTESDEYPVCIIEASQLDAAQSFASALGQRIAVLDKES